MSRAGRIFGPVSLNIGRRQLRSRFPLTQTRNLLTAATFNPPTQLSADNPTQVLPGLVEAAFAWGARGFKSANPPSHSVILISRDLLPSDNQVLLSSLSIVRQLSVTNTVVGIVDKVGIQGKGVSLLLASQDEGVTFETVKGTETELLRVGRWHAKDQEPDEEEPFDFDNVIASMKKGSQIKSVKSTGKEAIGKEFVLALGDGTTLQQQALEINQQYPTAEIVSSIPNKLT
jgi:hypothetical protein